ncbi:uncharacterized protein AKAW2_50787A [Aspergillus luchuensis]|uniref:Uncharacterized protein n=1 Tax=Aspergillus kawachii TaxID=1069201 RepID=A0A7R7ZZT1_ASPKA|nr:uncharacterized protein AKAW2_50787A [Aspergillus luchuensis]BCS00446.1 hypothetical protein AKAW2_50787A [Aspergillus luchuensis]
MSIETRLSSAPESICQELELRTGVTSVNDSIGMKAGGKGPTSPSASLPGPVHKYLVCRPSVRSSYKSQIDPRALCTGGVRCKGAGSKQAPAASSLGTATSDHIARRGSLVVTPHGFGYFLRTA